jgi:hypothetical protein
MLYILPLSICWIWLSMKDCYGYCRGRRRVSSHQGGVRDHRNDDRAMGAGDESLDCSRDRSGDGDGDGGASHESEPLVTAEFRLH